MASPHLYLIRHAKAEHDHPRGDAARRLTPQGRKAFRELVTALRPRLGVDRIVTSPFARARETAEVLAEITGAPIEEEHALVSGASSGRAILALARMAGAGVALVGHNPEIAEAIAIVSERDEHVRPGTVAALDLDGALAVAWIEAPARAE